MNKEYINIMGTKTAVKSVGLIVATAGAFLIYSAYNIGAGMGVAMGGKIAIDHIEKLNSVMKKST